MAENVAQRLCCRMLQTGEQAVWLGIKLKSYAVECCRLESKGYAIECGRATQLQSYMEPCE